MTLPLPGPVGPGRVLVTSYTRACSAVLSRPEPPAPEAVIRRCRICGTPVWYDPALTLDPALARLTEIIQCIPCVEIELHPAYRQWLAYYRRHGLPGDTLWFPDTPAAAAHG